jgi:hypothetical protein
VSARSEAFPPTIGRENPSKRWPLPQPSPVGHAHRRRGTRAAARRGAPAPRRPGRHRRHRQGHRPPARPAGSQRRARPHRRRRRGAGGGRSPPRPRLAVAAGVATGVPGGLRVDRRRRTNLPDILVAGDGVETYHRLLDRPAYLPLGTTAHQQGRVAGEACSAGSASPSAPPWPPSRGTPITTSDFETEVAHNPAREPS